jgi:hypothetical protein
MKREKLEAFDANTRKDAAQMIGNLQHPTDTRRLKGILAWRVGLTDTERSKLNHPSSVARRWRADTEPVKDKEAGRKMRDMQKPQKNAHIAAVADAEGDRDEALRHAEVLRSLLGQTLDQADIPEELRQAILKALAG